MYGSLNTESRSLMNKRNISWSQYNSSLEYLNICWSYEDNLSHTTSVRMVRSLGPEQLAELRQAFNLFDADCGGNISSKELGYAMRSLGMNPTEKDILDILNEGRCQTKKKSPHFVICNVSDHLEAISYLLLYFFLFLTPSLSSTRTTRATLTFPSFVRWWEHRWAATTTRKWSDWLSGSWTGQERAASSLLPSNIWWWI